MGINWQHINGCNNARDAHVEATVKYLFICFFLGLEAVLPTEAAIEFEKKRDLSEELQEGVFAPDKDCQKQVTVLPIAETPNKKVKPKISHEHVLEQQYIAPMKMFLSNST